MPLKDVKAKSSSAFQSINYKNSEMTIAVPCFVNVTVILEGNFPGLGDWTFLTLFQGQIVLEGKWRDGLVLKAKPLSLDLNDIHSQQLIANHPLIFVLRTVGGKGGKEPDPLLNTDNRAGATVDLLPLVIGEEEVTTRVPLVLMSNGEITKCRVQCFAKATERPKTSRVPLTITILSAHCLPYTKEGTVYIGAMGLNHILDCPAVNFGMSLSSANASKLVWASASNGGQAANTAVNIPNEDIFIPRDFEIQNSGKCHSVYWNAMRRALVDPILLRDRLSGVFPIEVAGIPRTGKIEVRGRYMGFVDPGVLLVPGQYSVTICTELLYYNESKLPENARPLLDLPPTSAKISARETDLVTDELGHSAYIIIRLDLTEALVPKTKLSLLYETIGFSPPEVYASPIDMLEVDFSQDEPTIDVRRIRKDGGALEVHKELSGLACKGAVPMNQGIKRTAANKLLMKVRTMLKQFPPSKCSLIDWQDTVTFQHAACRRAVTASFAPQVTIHRGTPKVAAARCRIAGDKRLADMHVVNDLATLRKHPRPLLSKALRLLEEGKDSDAKYCLLQALSLHTRNKFLLWSFGAQEFDKGSEGFQCASAAFRIAMRGDSSDATTNAIGWAALHALDHHDGNYYNAFVAVKKMRKSYELPKEWRLFYNRWTGISGEEEVYWIPTSISSDDPILIAAAFFLCLRCYSFTERLLKCYEEKCSIRGSRVRLHTKASSDVYYIRAASCLIKQEYDKALALTNEGIKRYGPSAMMSQMRATCLCSIREWDRSCEAALVEAEGAGAETCPSLLLKGALCGMTANPQTSLQRAARVHKIAPSAHSALVIARIYRRLGEEALAERWAAAAVNLEPMLADGWALLALLAMCQRDVHRARTMLRTAKQAGPLSPDIHKEVQNLMDIVRVETLPDELVKNICFCDYY